MNVIDSENVERAAGEKPGFTFRHPALAAIAFLALCLGLAGCDKCGNPIKINTPKVPGSCYGPSEAR